MAMFHELVMKFDNKFYNEACQICNILPDMKIRTPSKNYCSCSRGFGVHVLWV